jgi:hypothetical protein
LDGADSHKIWFSTRHSPPSNQYIKSVIDAKQPLRIRV